MDECEKLCNRLAIMTHGKLQCIGPTLQLKQQFDLGTRMIVVLKSSKTKDHEMIKRYLTKMFRRCRFRDSYCVRFYGLF